MNINLKTSQHLQTSLSECDNTNTQPSYGVSCSIYLNIPCQYAVGNVLDVLLCCYLKISSSCNKTKRKNKALCI